MFFEKLKKIKFFPVNLMSVAYAYGQRFLSKIKL